jgi:uncharacterized damage-inducible protein DinB
MVLPFYSSSADQHGMSTSQWLQTLTAESTTKRASMTEGSTQQTESGMDQSDELWRTRLTGLVCTPNADLKKILSEPAEET